MLNIGRLRLEGGGAWMEAGRLWCNKTNVLYLIFIALNCIVLGPLSLQAKDASLRRILFGKVSYFLVRHRVELMVDWIYSLVLSDGGP